MLGETHHWTDITLAALYIVSMANEIRCIFYFPILTETEESANIIHWLGSSTDVKKMITREFLNKEKYRCWKGLFNFYINSALKLYIKKIFFSKSLFGMWKNIQKFRILTQKHRLTPLSPNLQLAKIKIFITCIGDIFSTNRRLQISFQGPIWLYTYVEEIVQMCKRNPSKFVTCLMTLLAF